MPAATASRFSAVRSGEFRGQEPTTSHVRCAGVLGCAPWPTFASSSRGLPWRRRSRSRGWTAGAGERGEAPRPGALVVRRPTSPGRTATARDRGQFLVGAARASRFRLARTNDPAIVCISVNAAARCCNSLGFGAVLAGQRVDVAGVGPALPCRRGYGRAQAARQVTTPVGAIGGRFVPAARHSGRGGCVSFVEGVVRPPQEPLRAMTSTVPVVLLRRNNMLERPTVLGPSRPGPRGGGDERPGGDVEAGLDDAVVAEGDAAAGVRAEQAALADRHDLLAAADRVPMNRSATTDVAAVPDDDAGRDPASTIEVPSVPALKLQKPSCITVVPSQCGRRGAPGRRGRCGRQRGSRSRSMRGNLSRPNTARTGPGCARASGPCRRVRGGRGRGSSTHSW